MPPLFSVSGPVAQRLHKQAVDVFVCLHGRASARALTLRDRRLTLQANLMRAQLGIVSGLEARVRV